MEERKKKDVGRKSIRGNKSNNTKKKRKDEIRMEDTETGRYKIYYQRKCKIECICLMYMQHKFLGIYFDHDDMDC
jgi:hypothetical protein